MKWAMAYCMSRGITRARTHPHAWLCAQQAERSDLRTPSGTLGSAPGVVSSARHRTGWDRPATAAPPTEPCSRRPFLPPASAQSRSRTCTVDMASQVSARLGGLGQPGAPHRAPPLFARLHLRRKGVSTERRRRSRAQYSPPRGLKSSLPPNRVCVRACCWLMHAQSATWRHSTWTTQKRWCRREAWASVSEPLTGDERWTQQPLID
jgi:hypothetical protein